MRTPSTTVRPPDGAVVGVAALWLTYFGGFVVLAIQHVGYINRERIVHYMWGEIMEPKHLYFWVVMTSLAVIYTAATLLLMFGWPFGKAAVAARRRRSRVAARAAELIDRGYTLDDAFGAAEKEIVTAATASTEMMVREGIE
jgi:hypothetical protein